MILCTLWVVAFFFKSYVHVINISFKTLFENIFAYLDAVGISSCIQIT